MGITLVRNSKDQFQDPRFIDVEDKDAQAGDLLFFIGKSGKVGHVGMMINSEEFIHSFPKGPACITLDRLSDDRWRNGYYTYGIKLKRLKK
jgi:cell wall-associated NlpC family hydrolase